MLNAPPLGCFFCEALTNPTARLASLPQIANELFVAAWDGNPVTPGHALVIPRRHVQHMKDLTNTERHSLIDVILEVKATIKTVDLTATYKKMMPRVANTKSEAFVACALQQLAAQDGRAPDAFNDGINDGPAAGQTVPHFHWHVMPRWTNDWANPRGGIRHMFAGKGNYHSGLKI